MLKQNVYCKELIKVGRSIQRDRGVHETNIYNYYLFYNLAMKSTTSPWLSSALYAIQSIEHGVASIWSVKPKASVKLTELRPIEAQRLLNSTSSLAIVAGASMPNLRYSVALLRIQSIMYNSSISVSIAFTSELSHS